jgi:hypothetical protein
VRDKNGRVGVVEYVEYATSHERPDALHIRTGYLRLRRFPIPVEKIQAIDPLTRTVWLSQPDMPARDAPNEAPSVLIVIPSRSSRPA